MSKALFPANCACAGRQFLIFSVEMMNSFCCFIVALLMMGFGPQSVVTALGQSDQPDKKKSAPAGFYDIESPQAASILKRFPNFVILDIRTPKEFAAGHLKGAKNVDFFGNDFASKIEKLDRKKSYLVHCASGGRSGRSMKIFKDKGFTAIYHLADGYKGWVAAKQPTVTP